MKKIIISSLAIILFMQLNAQKNIDGLIAAEKAFAKYALDKTTKQAFLQFMDSTALQFANGKPIKSVDLWAKREDNKTILKWQPQFAEIDASNDFGYTTGPWTFQNTEQDSIAARGQYTTVWRVNENGEWKFLVDFGHANKINNLVQEVKKIRLLKTTKADEQSLLQAQQSFNEIAAINLQTAYQRFLSAQSILNRSELLPLTNTVEQLSALKDLTRGISFNIQGSGIAGSDDIGYVYGAMTYKEKTDNYLHIWRHEKTGWKLAVVVIHL